MHVLPKKQLDQTKNVTYQRADSLTKNESYLPHVLPKKQRDRTKKRVLSVRGFCNKKTGLICHVSSKKKNWNEQKKRVLPARGYCNKKAGLIIFSPTKKRILSAPSLTKKTEQKILVNFPHYFIGLTQQALFFSASRHFCWHAVLAADQFSSVPVDISFYFCSRQLFCDTFSPGDKFSACYSTLVFW